MRDTQEREMDDSRRPRNLNPYEKPTVTKLTREQAMLIRRAHAVRGDPGSEGIARENACTRTREKL